MRDVVQVHITADLPIRSRTLSYADRVEIRLGKAFPVALIVDGPALAQLGDAIAAGKAELEQAEKKGEG
ncbi:hypothetical protein [Actinophytocola sp.]|uniref:hypothetical protein n=1 Tax=Actinophytocola sp. TaxID=1872138 RepID=UPI00389B237B